MCARRESQEGDFYGVRGGVYGNGGEKQSSPPAHRDINNISLSSVIGRLPAWRRTSSSNPILRYRGREKIKTDAIESNEIFVLIEEEEICSRMNVGRYTLSGV